MLEFELKLSRLFSQPEAFRDEQWEHQVLELLPQAKVRVISETPHQGPDGWPYLMVETSSGENGEPVARILHWLSEKGVGLVVNPKKYAPDYVLTYGMVWFYRVQGQFVNPHLASFQGPQAFNIPKGSQVVMGPPTIEYWPEFARKVLLEFLNQQGLKNPEVLVVGLNNSTYDLCFSLSSFGNPPQSEHQGILEALAWFFRLTTP